MDLLFALTHAPEGAVGKLVAANVSSSMHMGIMRAYSVQPTSRVLKRYHRAMFVVVYRMNGDDVVVRRHFAVHFSGRVLWGVPSAERDTPTYYVLDEETDLN